MKTSSIAVKTSRSTTQSDSVVRQTNKRSSCVSYTTMNNKHIFNDIKENSLVTTKQMHFQSKPGAHYPKGPTSENSCNGVFTLRLFLEGPKSSEDDTNDFEDNRISPDVFQNPKGTSRKGSYQIVFGNLRKTSSHPKITQILGSYQNLCVVWKQEAQAVLFSLELPKLTILELSPVVRSFPGYQRRWSVTGTPVIYTALTRNSTVLFNTTYNIGYFKLDNDGNYSFVAANRFGTDVRQFSAIITGKTLF